VLFQFAKDVRLGGQESCPEGNALRFGDDKKRNIEFLSLEKERIPPFLSSPVSWPRIWLKASRLAVSSSLLPGIVPFDIAASWRYETSSNAMLVFFSRG